MAKLAVALAAGWFVLTVNGQRTQTDAQYDLNRFSTEAECLYHALIRTDWDNRSHWGHAERKYGCIPEN